MIRKISKLSLLFIVCCALLSLTACSSDKTPDALKPMPLTKFQSSLSVKHLWSRNVGDGTSEYYLHLSPLVVGQTLFVAAYDGTIMAVNTDNNHRLWKRHLDKQLISGITAADGLLFVASNDGHLLAINQQNGEIAWSIALDTQALAVPQVAKGIVLVHTIDGALTAYAAKNGQELWQFREQAPNLMLHLSSQAQIIDNTVICGFANGQLLALSLDKGERQWVQQIAQPMGGTDVERMVDITANPVVVNDMIYVATYQGVIVAVNAKNGHITWQHKLSVYNDLSSDGKNLYASDEDGNIWAFDLQTGTVVWRNTQLARRGISAPTVIQPANALVVADYQGYVHFLSLSDGHLLARTRVNLTTVLAKPFVVGQNIYIYTMGGRLQAYRVSQRR